MWSYNKFFACLQTSNRHHSNSVPPEISDVAMEAPMKTGGALKLNFIRRFLLSRLRPPLTCVQIALPRASRIATDRSVYQASVYYPFGETPSFQTNAAVRVPKCD